MTTKIIQIVRAVVRLEIKDAKEKIWGMSRKKGIEKREDFQDSSWIKRLMPSLWRIQMVVGQVLKKRTQCVEKNDRQRIPLNLMVQ